MITLSIVIVNYNVCGFLEQCLLSVRDAVKGISHEIFVVDNASTDGSEAYISTRFPQVKYIYNTENVGFSKANNQAIAQSSGRYVLLLNPDTVVGESVLDEACHFLDEHDDAGALGVKMIDGDGKFLPESKRGFPSPWVSFCKIFGLSKLFPYSRRFGRYHLRFLDENSTHRVDVLSGAFMLLRRSTLDRCGLLDENFFMYGEDIDLSYRMTLTGEKITTCLCVFFITRERAPKPSHCVMCVSSIKRCLSSCANTILTINCLPCCLSKQPSI